MNIHKFDEVTETTTHEEFEIGNIDHDSEDCLTVYCVLSPDSTTTYLTFTKSEIERLAKAFTSLPNTFEL